MSRSTGLAKAIGVDARRIHAIVHGERSITAEIALLFSLMVLRQLRRLLDGSASQYDIEMAEDRLAENLDSVVPHDAIRPNAKNSLTGGHDGRVANPGCEE